jgi:hypothetical protein
MNRRRGKLTAAERETPGQSPAGAAKAARKEARLSAALRANLAKRKDQARARAGVENPTGQRATNPPQSPPKPPRSA